MRRCERPRARTDLLCIGAVLLCIGTGLLFPGPDVLFIAAHLLSERGDLLFIGAALLFISSHRHLLGPRRRPHTAHEPRAIAAVRRTIDAEPRPDQNSRRKRGKGRSEEDAEGDAEVAERGGRTSPQRHREHRGERGGKHVERGSCADVPPV